MRDCPYCGERLATEEEYVAHLHEAHDEDEFGRIDRRRVEQVYGTDSEASGDWTGPIVIVLVLLLTVGFVGAVIAIPGFGGGMGGGHGGGADASGGANAGPTCLGAVHYHGTMRMTVSGSPVDFSADSYQLQDRAFHFEGGDGTRWHVHAREVTLRYALSTLGIDVTESSATFDGETYRDSDPDVSVTISVDGHPATPDEYVLQRGDRVRIVVETGTDES